MINANPYTPEPMAVPVALINAMTQARRVVVFTGAGMSAESGIPTFRDAMHGLWAHYSAQELASPEGWKADRARVWAWYEWRRHLVMKAQPHAGHLAIPQLASALAYRTGQQAQVEVVTQNVDDLHERAGSQNVHHLHGSLFAPRCSVCAKPAEFSPALTTELVPSLMPPRCMHCQGFVRPGVVWFGEDLPSDVWRSAESSIKSCDVLLVVGTSGVVFPAAGLPALAERAGKWVAEINPTPSSLSSKVNLHWLTTAAQGLDSLLKALAK